MLKKASILQRIKMRTGCAAVWLSKVWQECSICPLRKAADPPHLPIAPAV